MKKVYYYVLITALFISSSTAKDKITLQLDWLHQFQFAGYYMAKEKGFYKQKGLDVTINEFDFNTNLLHHVVNQEAAYAVGKSSLVIDKISGINIVALAAIYQHSPMVLVTRKDSGISQPKDLFEKRVMLTPDARTAVAINSMISSQGIKLSDVKFQPHSFKLEDLINKNTDAMGCYLSNEPFILKQQGIEFNILDPRDYGFDFYGGLLFTSQKELSKHPKRVHDFYEATLQGWHYAFSNIQQTAQLIFDKYNSQNKSLAAFIYEGHVLSKLAQFKDNKLGKIDKNRYKEILKIYSLLGYEHTPNLLNEFIYNPHEIVLSKKEKDFLKNNVIHYKTLNKKPFTQEGSQGLEFEYLELIKKLIPIQIKTSNNNKQAYDMQLLNGQDNAFSLQSNALTQYPFAIVTQSNISFISSLNQLTGKKVVIIQDSFFDTLYKNSYKNFDYVMANTLKEGLNLIKNNEAYALIHSMPMTFEAMNQKQSKELKTSGLTNITHDIAFAINHPILHSIINKTLNSINQEDINAINDSYFTPSKHVHVEEKETYYLEISIAIIVFIIIIALYTKRLTQEIKYSKQLQKDIKRINNIDQITDVYNRYASVNTLNNTIEISKRYDRPLSVILFDINNFKKINQEYSLSIGDHILEELCTLVKGNIRITDVLGRMDGETFILILPETENEQAQCSAMHLKDIIYNHDFKNISTFLSCSFAVVSYEKNESTDSLIQRANELLHRIKLEKQQSVRVV